MTQWDDYTPPVERGCNCEHLPNGSKCYHCRLVERVERGGGPGSGVIVTDGGTTQATLASDTPDDQTRLVDDTECPRDVDWCEGPSAPDDVERKCAGCWIHGWPDEDGGRDE